jgi:hypothetical protein
MVLTVEEAGRHDDGYVDGTLGSAGCERMWVAVGRRKGNGRTNIHTVCRGDRKSLCFGQPSPDVLARARECGGDPSSGLKGAALSTIRPINGLAPVQ